MRAGGWGGDGRKMENCQENKEKPLRIYVGRERKKEKVSTTSLIRIGQRTKERRKETKIMKIEVNGSTTATLALLLSITEFVRTIYGYAFSPNAISYVFLSFLFISTHSFFYFHLVKEE